MDWNFFNKVHVRRRQEKRKKSEFCLTEELADCGARVAHESRR